MHGLEEQVGGANTAPAGLPIMKSGQHISAFGYKRLNLLTAEAKDSLGASSCGRGIRSVGSQDPDSRANDRVKGRVEHLALQTRRQTGNGAKPQAAGRWLVCPQLND